MWDSSTILFSGLSGLLGFLGLYLALRAVDFGFQLFGGLLVAFAVIYIVQAIQRVYPSRSR